MHDWRYTITKAALKSYEGEKYMSIRQKQNKYAIVDMDIWMKFFRMKSST